MLCKNSEGVGLHHSTCCSVVWEVALRFRRNLFARNLHLHTTYILEEAQQR